MDSTVIFFFAGVLIIGGLLLAVMTVAKKGQSQLDVDKYRSRWLAIEQQLTKDNPATYNLCILEADKLLDHAMRARGLKGETMGDRLKNSKNIWSNRNAIWSAHKLRNQIAHEADVDVNYDDARRALAGFKRALKDVGAI